jgi:hypothetical protein
MEQIDYIRQAYRKGFETPYGGIILADLAEYCNFLSTTTGNPYEEAKRDVFLHILDMYGVELPEVMYAIQKIPAHEKKEQGEADY